MGFIVIRKVFETVLITYLVDEQHNGRRFGGNTTNTLSNFGMEWSPIGSPVTS